MEKSLPRERWPSSNRIAANTEPPSCTRAARFVGCGWGKWVIAEKDYDLWAMLQEDYDRPSPDGPFPSPSKILEVLVLQQDAYIDLLDNGLTDWPPWAGIHSSQHLA